MAAQLDRVRLETPMAEPAAGGVMPGAESVDVSDVAAEAPRPQKRWSELASEPDFQALSSAEQEQVRSIYFDRVIAPGVASADRMEARRYFDEQSRPGKLARLGHDAKRTLDTAADAVGPTVHRGVTAAGGLLDRARAKLAEPGPDPTRVARQPMGGGAGADRLNVPPEGMALLGSIASTESPGYDVLYGGRRFSDFRDHPRVDVPIQSGPNRGKTSSAAGRYQFLKGTWDDQAQKLGLTDFSPASQDAAAWNLARETYQAKRGRDLLTDLRSGDPQVLAGIGQTLSGVWTSLPSGIEATTSGGRFADKFKQQLQGGGGAAEASAPMPKELYGLPLKRGYIDAVRAEYDAASPAQRAALVARGDTKGRVAQFIHQGYQQADRLGELDPELMGVGTRREDREQGYLNRGMDARSAQAMADRDLQLGLLPGGVGEAATPDWFRSTRPTLGQAAGIELQRGGKNLEAIGAGLGAWGADALGLGAGLGNLEADSPGEQRLVKSFLDDYTRLTDEAERSPPVIGDFANIDTSDPQRAVADATRYGVEMVMGNLPMFLPSLGTGMVTGAIARRAATKAVEGLVAKLGAAKATQFIAEKAAAGAQGFGKIGAAAEAIGARNAAQLAQQGVTQAAARVAPRAATGAAIGAGEGAVGMETGSIYGDIAKETGQQKPGVAAVAGLAAGALDAIPAWRAATKLVGPAVADEIAGTVMQRLGKEAGIQFLSEGGTEFVQTLIENGAVHHVQGQPYVNAQDVHEALNAALAGGVSGGVIGGATQGWQEATRPPSRAAQIGRALQEQLDVAGGLRAPAALEPEQVGQPPAGAPEPAIGAGAANDTMAPSLPVASQGIPETANPPQGSANEQTESAQSGAAGAAGPDDRATGGADLLPVAADRGRGGVGGSDGSGTAAGGAVAERPAEPGGAAAEAGVPVPGRGPGAAAAGVSEREPGPSGTGQPPAEDHSARGAGADDVAPPAVAWENWDRLHPGQREHLMAQAGWRGAKGGANAFGKKAAGLAWADLKPAVREKLQGNQAGGGPVKTAGDVPETDFGNMDATRNVVEQTHERQEGQGQGSGQERLLSQPPERSPGVRPAGAGAESDQSKSAADEQATQGFDPAAWDKARDKRIAASRAAGNKHLDKLEPFVGSLRGKRIQYVHDPKVTGEIRTVDTNGIIYVRWSDKYSGDKNSASEAFDKKGKLIGYDSILMPRDGKDFVVTNPGHVYDPETYRPPRSRPQQQPAATAVEKPDVDGEQATPWDRLEGDARERTVKAAGYANPGGELSAFGKRLLGQDWAGIKPATRQKLSKVMETPGQTAQPIIHEAGGVKNVYQNTQSSAVYGEPAVAQSGLGQAVRGAAESSEGAQPDGSENRHPEEAGAVAAAGGSEQKAAGSEHSGVGSEQMPAEQSPAQDLSPSGGTAGAFRPTGAGQGAVDAPEAAPAKVFNVGNHRVEVSEKLGTPGRFVARALQRNGSVSAILGEFSLGRKGGATARNYFYEAAENRRLLDSAADQFAQDKLLAQATEVAKEQGAAPSAKESATARPADYGSNNKVFTKERAEQAREILRKKLSQVNAGFDPEIAAAGLELAGYHIEAGARAWADYARAMVADIGEAVRPYLRSFYESARHAPGLDKQGLDTSANLDIAEQYDIWPGDTWQPKDGNEDLAFTVWKYNAYGKPIDEDGRELLDLRDVDGFKKDWVRVGRAGADRNQPVSLAPPGPAPSGSVRNHAAKSVANPATAVDKTPSVADTDSQKPTQAVAAKNDQTAEVQDVGRQTNRADGGTGAARAGAEAVSGAGKPGAAATVPGGQAGGDRGAGKRAVDAGDLPDRPSQSKPSGARPTGNLGGTASVGAGGANLPDLPRGDDYRITPGAIAREGSWLDTARRNVEVVELVHRLEREGRPATAEEQAQLARFTGWGAADIRNQLFPAKAKSGVRYDPSVLSGSWKDLGQRVAEVFNKEDWKTALRSTQYAHYTSEPVVRALWQAAERFGFAGGSVLEPGAGIGHFAGLMPDGIYRNSRYLGIEMDGFTARIAQLLYPGQTIRQGDYVRTKAPRDFFDLAIGNPPFAATPITDDPEYARQRFSLHDYFFAKTLDRVRPGGLLLFVTSRHTLDKQGDKARQYLADRADFLGAVRLPNTAFQANAGTQVVTDIIMLRKREAGQAPGGETWTGLGELRSAEGEAVPVNEYFARHPEMILGQVTTRGDTLNAGEKFTVNPQPGELAEQIAAAMERLPQNVYSVAGPGAAADTARKTAVAKDFNPKYRKEGGIYRNEAGELLRVEQGVGVPLGELMKLSAKDRAWLGDYVPLRDALKQAQYDQLSDGDWEASLQELNQAYDAFVAQHGPIRAFTETETTQLDEEGNEETIVRRRYKHDRLLKVDIDGKGLVAYLEQVKEDGTIEKAAILQGRVLKQPTRREIASVNDALAVSLADTGRFDLADVARLAGLDKAAALAQLGDLVYAVPGGGHVLVDEYLSGDVKTKLDEAEAAAAIDRSFARNVEALTRVQPAALVSADVTVGLGATWVPMEHYREFAREVVGLANPRLTYHAANNEFVIEADERRQLSRSESAEWGTAYRSPLEVLDAALNRRTVKVYTGRGTKEDPKILNVEETQKVETLTRQLAERFSSWVWTDAPRTEKLLDLYNDKFNRLAPRYFDGAHIDPPGLSLRYKLHPHQKRAIWRAIQTGNTYFAHAVGAGKTLEMIIAGMEQKRLGLINKPMYVVPGHMLEQFAAEFLEAYPAANIMVADEENFAADNRRRFIAQAALNSPDAIIITHSAFTLLEMKPENQAAAFDDVIDDLRASLEELPDDFENRKTRSKIEAQLERIERAMSGASTERFTQRNKLQALQVARKDAKAADRAALDAQIAAQEIKARKEELNAERDKSVLFEDLGVDFLFVDEAHEFRKLDYATKMTIKGLSPEGSVKALKLFVKTRWLEKQRPGRAFAFASGTPITNTLAELYTIQRFFHEQELRDKGLIHFDAWAANFAQVKTEYERNATGKIEAVDRLSKFVNVADLMSMVRQQMDVLTSSELAHLVKLPTPVPGNAGKREIIVTPQTEALAEYMGGELSRRLEESRAWKPTKEQPNNPDPVINIITDGRVAALDMRYIDPSLPNDADSKLNHLADRIIQHYQDTADLTYTDPATGQVEPVKGGTQIVFASLGFGPGIAQTRGFDGRAWINKRLREAGIPASQVAWIWDYPTAAAKQAMFKEMRQGQKRILIGSPKNMGTGVNVQKRLTHKIDLDAPWYPSDLEQPDGRILRQGNQNEYVTLEGLAAEGTYDSTMYGMVSRKAGFIEQAFRGDRSLRAMEDISAASSYAMAAAIASGDPRYMQLTELESTVSKLETEKELHERRQSALRADISVLKGNGPALRERIQKAEKVQQTLAGLTFYSGYLEAVVAGRELRKAKTSELGEAIAAAVDQEFAEALATVQRAALNNQRPGQDKVAGPLHERVYEKVIGTVHGKAELVLAVHVDARRVKDGKGQLTESLHAKHQSATVRLRVAGETLGRAVDVWQREPAPNRADSVGRAVSMLLNSQQREALSKARLELEENQDALEKAERAFGVPFPRQAALVRAVTDLASLRDELTREGKEIPDAAVKASVLPDYSLVRPLAKGGDRQSGYLAGAYGWPGVVKEDTPKFIRRDGGAPTAEQLRKEYEATRARYVDTPQWLKAPNGQPSNLNETQWVQVRTPRFKAWFGDFEIASQSLRPARNFAEAREASKEFQGRELTNRAGLVASVSRNNLDKMLSASAVHKSEVPAEHALAVANLDRLFSIAEAGWSKTDRDGDANLAAIHRLFAPMRVGNMARLVKLTVKEFTQSAQGNRIYSVESIEVTDSSPVPEMVDADRAHGSRLLTGPTGLIDSLVDRVLDFNTRGVSKVVDENGEPLVVYHGTTGARTAFEPYWQQLERDALPHELTGSGSIARLYEAAKAEPEMHFFFEERDAAETYGGDVVEAFLRVNKPVVDGDRDAAIDAMLNVDADGATFDDTTSSGRYGGKAWLVRGSTQIKSATGNTGAFSPENPDIRYRRGAAGVVGAGRSGGDQAAARALNAGLAKHFNDPSWERAYVQADLPDGLAEFAEAARAAFGAEVVGILPTDRRFDAFDGINHGGRNYVNLNAPAGFIPIAGHELLHQLKKDRPDLYRWFVNHARGHYRNVAEYRDRLNALVGPGEQPYNLAAAEEELLADFTGDALADPAFVRRLAEADPGRFRQLLNAVVNWLKRVASRLRAAGLGSSEYIRDVEALREHLAAALAAYARGGPVAVGRLEGPKFSRSAMKSPVANLRRGEQAMNTALLEKRGVSRAMYHQDLGWIDFVWGDNRKGIQHILKQRLEKDGMSADEIYRLLTKEVPRVIATGEVIRRQARDGSERVVMGDLRHEAVLVKNRGGNGWMLSAWEVKTPGATQKANDFKTATPRAADSSDDTRVAGAVRELSALARSFVKSMDGSAGSSMEHDDIRFARRRPASDTLEQAPRPPKPDKVVLPEWDGSAEQAFAQVDTAVREGGGWPEFKRELGDRWHAMSGKARRQALGALMVHQLVEVGQRVLPRLTTYLQEMTAMDATRNRVLHEVDGIAKDWEKLGKPTMARLALVMHESTLAGVDGSEAFTPSIDLAAAAKRIGVLKNIAKGAGGDRKIPTWQKEVEDLRAQVAHEKQRRNEYQRIKALYESLPKPARDIYQRARDYHVAQSRRVEEALVEMIEKTHLTGASRAAAVTKLRQEFEAQRVNAPYFPLGRQGDYWVSVKPPQAEGRRAGPNEFHMFPTYEAQQRFVEESRAAGLTVLGHGKQLENLQEVVGVSGSFVAQVEDILGQLADGPMVQAARDAVYQLYLQTLPDLSARKHFIHRKKTPGFGTDALRAFAHKGYHDAYQYARVKHGFELRTTMEQLRDDVTAASGEAKLRSAETRKALLEEFRDEVLNAGLGFAAVQDRADQAAGAATRVGDEAAGLDLTEGERFVKDEAKKWGQFLEWMQEWTKYGGIPDRIQRELREIELRLESARRINAMPRGREFAADIANELQAAYAWMMNPRTAPWATWLNQLSYLWNLAFSPSAWITNATQNPLVAMPYVAARHGVGATRKAFVEAYRQAFQGALRKDPGKQHRLGIYEALTDGEELQAYEWALDSGIIERGRAMDLAGVAEEGQARSVWHRKFAAAMTVGFHDVEMLNRETTFMAAYRLARRAGEGWQAAVDYAGQTVNKTHLVYSAENRPRFMRSDVARVALQFKLYSQGISYLLGKAVVDALGPNASAQEKAEARKFLVLQLGMQSLAAGALGLPVGLAWWGAQAAFAALFDDDDEPKELEPEFRQALAELLGKTGGEAVAKGPINALSPIDIHSRVGMRELWFRENDREVEGKDAATQMLSNALGPIAGIAEGLAVGAKLIGEGHWWRGLEKMTPKAVRDPLKMLRYWDEGAQTLKGDTLVEDLTLGELIGQGLGFSPSRLNERYDENNAVMNREKRLEDRRRDLAGGLAQSAIDAGQAKRAYDQDAYERAMQRFEDFKAKARRFGAKNPALGVTGDTVERSVRSRLRARALAQHGIFPNRRIPGRYDYAGE